MMGKSPLWVSKQHGHSLETMLRIYTAWAQGAMEADIKHIERAMAARPKGGVVARPSLLSHEANSPLSPDTR